MNPVNVDKVNKSIDSAVEWFRQGAQTKAIAELQVVEALCHLTMAIHHAKINTTKRLDFQRKDKMAEQISKAMTLAAEENGGGKVLSVGTVKKKIGLCCRILAGYRKTGKKTFTANAIENWLESKSDKALTESIVTKMFPDHDPKKPIQEAFKTTTSNLKDQRELLDGIDPDTALGKIIANTVAALETQQTELRLALDAAKQKKAPKKRAPKVKSESGKVNFRKSTVIHPAAEKQVKAA